MSIQDEFRRYLLSFISGPDDDRSLMEILGIIRRDGSLLLVQSYELFRAEVREKIHLLTKDAIILLLGGTFLWVSLLAFVTASIIVLAFFVPLWLAAVIVSLVFGFFGLVLVFYGITLFRRRTLMPLLTAEALRENARWLRERGEKNGP